MQKLILIALLVCSVYSLAGVGTTCTVNTNGWDDNGVCRFCHPTCKTCKDSTASGCLTCNSVAEADKTTDCVIVPDPASGGGACACPSATPLLTVKTAAGTAYDFQCCAKAKLPDLTDCPAGFGKFSGGTTSQEGCLPCGDAQANCKSCDLATADSSAIATVCTDCFAGSVSSDACTISTAAYIRYQGEVASCPDGHFPHATTKECTPLGKWCKTGTSATVCTECIAKHGLKADKSCELCASEEVDTTTKACKPKLPDGCTQADTADATKCAVDKCDTAKFWKKNTAIGACECQQNYWKKVVAADAANNVKAATTCEACADTARTTCLAADTCSADGKKCTEGTTTPAVVPASEKPGFACKDATLKASGCVKCDDAGAKCETCFAGQTFNATDKVCACTGTSDMVTFDAGTNACVTCTKCTDATKKYCNIKTAGTASAKPVTECTGTSPAEAAKAAGAAAAAGGAAGNDSNGILISAISMILAVILA